MSETTATLRRKIAGAGDLQSVVRTMKVVAASSIGQYENSVRALADYYCAGPAILGHRSALRKLLRRSQLHCPPKSRGKGLPGRAPCQLEAPPSLSPCREAGPRSSTPPCSTHSRSRPPR
jgi:hypothetical protein